MPQTSFVRAILMGAAAMIAVLLAYHLLRGRGDSPPPAANAFNPAASSPAAPRLDVPYVVTDNEVVDAMLGLAGVRPDDDVIDLGSGDGRILIAAARSYGAHGLGVDIDPARIRRIQRQCRRPPMSPASSPSAARICSRPRLATPRC